VRSTGWHTRDGAAVVDIARLENEALQVVEIANKMAGREQRRTTLRDLRHACTVLCLGRDKDTDTLNNSEQDYIVSLFKVLANPLDIAARSAFESYKAGKNPGAVKRQKYFIHSRAPEAVLRKLTFDLTSGRTRDPEALDDDERQALARLLAQRGVYGHRPKIQQEQAELTEVGGQKSEAGGQTSDIRPPASGPKDYVMNPQLTFTKGPF
jgi:hypothetical protein